MSKGMKNSTFFIIFTELKQTLTVKNHQVFISLYFSNKC